MLPAWIGRGGHAEMSGSPLHTTCNADSGPVIAAGVLPLLGQAAHELPTPPLDKRTRLLAMRSIEVSAGMRVCRARRLMYEADIVRPEGAVAATAMLPGERCLLLLGALGPVVPLLVGRFESLQPLYVVGFHGSAGHLSGARDRADKSVHVLSAAMGRLPIAIAGHPPAELSLRPWLWFSLHYSRGPRGTVPGTAGILAGRDAGGVGPQAAARQGRPALSDAHE